MPNNLVPNPSQMPAAALARRQQHGSALAKNFALGVQDAFPVMSIKGKMFTYRNAGQDHPVMVNIQGRMSPSPFLDVVLINASKDLSKVYYAKGFTEGDMDPPDCWSLDSIKPDSSIGEPVNPTCKTCPMNAFGSRVTQAGTKVKACQDSRRLVIVSPTTLGVGVDSAPIMMRVPQTSLKNLREHVLYLDRHNVDANAVISTISFDPNEAYPKLTFEYKQMLNDAQYAQVEALMADERTDRILQAPIDGPSSDELDPAASGGIGLAAAKAAPYSGLGAAAGVAAPQPTPTPQPTPQPPPPPPPAAVAQPFAPAAQPAMTGAVSPPVDPVEAAIAMLPPEMQEAMRKQMAAAKAQPAPVVDEKPQVSVPEAKPAAGGYTVIDEPVVQGGGFGSMEPVPPEGTPGFLLPADQQSSPAQPQPTRKRRTAPAPAAEAPNDVSAASASLDSLLSGLMQQ